MGDLGQLHWDATVVAGRPATFGVGGDGAPLVFLHGWALGYRSYRHALSRLVADGWHVLAPGLPGLSGTPSLPVGQRSLQGYADWVAEFCAAVGVEGAAVVGHSFGGGVAIQVAHDFPEMVAQLVLVNSIGGSAWAHRGGVLRSITERPLWDWGLHFQADVMPLRQATRVLPVVLEDAVPSLLRNPVGVLHVAAIARSADLQGELEELRRRRLPTVVVWGRDDRVLPALSGQSLCDTSGRQRVTVPGSDGWLLADPAAFGEVMTNIVELPALTAAPRHRWGRRAA